MRYTGKLNVATGVCVAAQADDVRKTQSVKRMHKKVMQRDGTEAGRL